MEFKLENMDRFSNAIFPLIRFHDTADLKCSPTMFSLIISRHFPHIITSLQIMPPFFTNFLCQHQIYQCQIPIKLFHRTIITMKHAFYSSMTLSLEQPLNRISLQFHNSRVDQQLFSELPLLPSREEDVGQIDYGIFVSIDSQVFKRIATELDDFNVSKILWYFVSALVTLTNSQAKFTVEGRDISLHEEV
ncbi:unnamed protein product [Citrullus colocynthis]|uniref:Uncharacterized protein n=1 Tax=Citrullus colocynthis TaxID=252529 RepID=A0ABP0Z7U4_9ROSI